MAGNQTGTHMLSHPVILEASMTKPEQAQQESAAANPEKDPQDWVTGDETMTGPQASYLETLCREAGEEFDPQLTKAEASQRIEELQARTGRGRDH
jgi:hypothetical protein